MTITDKLANPKSGEFYNTEVAKSQIYLHHTAGSHRPDFTIDGWLHDRNKAGNVLPVATAYVIGGISTTDKNADYDGKIYRFFNDKCWAHHLGTSLAQNTLLNQQSIGIEICNYGPISKVNGRFLNYVDKEVPADMVEELPVPFRNFTHYHKYTEKQMVALKELLIDISKRHNIDLKKGLYDKMQHLPMNRMGEAFNVMDDAVNGKPGLYTHTNVRRDKFDCSPQTILIKTILSL